MNLYSAFAHPEPPADDAPTPLLPNGLPVCAPPSAVRPLTPPLQFPAHKPDPRRQHPASANSPNSLKSSSRAVASGKSWCQPRVSRCPPQESPWGLPFRASRQCWDAPPCIPESEHNLLHFREVSYRNHNSHKACRSSVGNSLSDWFIQTWWQSSRLDVYLIKCKLLRLIFHFYRFLFFSHRPFFGNEASAYVQAW